MVDNLIDVHMPGGVINIEIKPDGHVYMTGSVSAVYSGKLAEQLLEQLV
jgi:diaminopimelate epimerase